MQRSAAYTLEPMRLAGLCCTLALNIGLTARPLHAAPLEHAERPVEHIVTPVLHPQNSERTIWSERVLNQSPMSGKLSAARSPTLDLRPPSFREFSILENDRVASYNRNGSNSEHTLSIHGSASREEENDSSLPSLGTAEHGRFKSKAQEFAERFHREGLPIARLWESRSALVSLGLNQKGKAGLWLVQKTH